MSPEPIVCCGCSGPERYRMLTQARLADGIMDASVLVVYETRFRPDLPHSPRWLEHQRGKINRGLVCIRSKTARPGQDRCRFDRLVLRARLS